MTYFEKKNKARNLAIYWQYNFSRREHSYNWLIQWQERFERIGKKYGLIREFKLNGIL